MFNNIKKISLISLISANSLFAIDDCNVNVAIDHNINANIIKSAQNIGFYSKIEKEFNCKLSLVEYPSYSQVLNSYVAQETDAMLTRTFDVMAYVGASIPTSNIVLISSSNKSDVILSKNNKTIQDLKNKNIYLTKKTSDQYLVINEIIKNGLDPKDFNFVNIENETKLLEGFESGVYENIFTTVLNGLENKKYNSIYFKNSDNLILDSIAMNRNINNYENKSEFVKKIWKETNDLITKNLGTQLSLFFGEFQKISKTDLNTSKNLINNNNIISESNKEEFYKNNLFEIESKSYNFIGANKMFRYPPKYKINILNKTIGQKNEHYYIAYDLFLTQKD